MDGVLLVDKSRGPTSHDVVARLRRILGQRSIGHAGTLDPMATGLLVIGLGEGTKLLTALTDDDKGYEATLELGRATDTLDAEGQVLATAEVPPGLDVASVQRAADTFIGPHRQVAPAYSAIKRDGVPLHERARRGEVIELPVRDVVLRRVVVHSVEGASIRFSLRCAKGFYVRSFARDLAEHLGTVGHLTALRRTSSGALDVANAVSYEALLGPAGRELATGATLTLVQACAGLPTAVLSETGLVDAKHGRPVRRTDVVAGTLELGSRIALLTTEPRLVALATVEAEHLRIARGFNDTAVATKSADS